MNRQKKNAFLPGSGRISLSAGFFNFRRASKK